MATTVWNSERSYCEGQRVSYKGDTFDARMDLVRNTRPDGPMGKTFWRKANILPPMKADTTPARVTRHVAKIDSHPTPKRAKQASIPAPSLMHRSGSYITRDMGRLSRDD